MQRAQLCKLHSAEFVSNRNVQKPTTGSIFGILNVGYYRKTNKPTISNHRFFWNISNTRSYDKSTNFLASNFSLCCCIHQCCYNCVWQSKRYARTKNADHLTRNNRGDTIFKNINRRGSGICEYRLVCTEPGWSTFTVTPASNKHTTRLQHNCSSIYNKNTTIFMLRIQSIALHYWLTFIRPHFVSDIAIFVLQKGR